jgi:uncharacterized protein (DUF2141 family)
MLREILLTTLAFCLLGHSGSYGQNKLYITVTDIKSKGTVYIAIYDKPDCFGKPHKAYRKLATHSDGGVVTTTADNLPSGSYSVAVYQDLNNNKKVDKNVLGIPTEPFAFSNNIHPTVSAPTFKQCKVTVDKPERGCKLNCVKVHKLVEL